MADRSLANGIATGAARSNQDQRGGGADSHLRYYYWNSMTQLPGEFIKKIAHSLQEEEVDVYVLNLYYMDSDDLNYFQKKDRERIKKIFKTLIDDTHHHTELLKLIVEMGTS